MYYKIIKITLKEVAVGCFGVSCRQTDLWLKTETGNRA